MYAASNQLQRHVREHPIGVLYHKLRILQIYIKENTEHMQLSDFVLLRMSNGFRIRLIDIVTCSIAYLNL